MDHPPGENESLLERSAPLARTESSARGRRFKSLGLVGIVALAAWVFMAWAANSWSPAASMPYAIASHTATLLSSGQVLVVGGIDVMDGTHYRTLANAESYDPNGDTWNGLELMQTRREFHSATLLASGKVLVAGGVDVEPTARSGPFATSEFYDPSVDAWTYTQTTMSTARYSHTATLLPSGKVLVVGGIDETKNASASVEIYDPILDQWSAAASLNTPRLAHTATLLPSGNVLVVGGESSGNQLASVEIYNQLTDSWAPGPSLNTARNYHTATLLSSGQVLVTGGIGLNQGTAEVLKSVEIYDPIKNTWTPLGDLTASRESQTATLLPSGFVLIVGGDDGKSPLSSAELYNPGAGTSAATPNLAAARSFHTATLLPSGQVLVAGGITEFTTSTTLASVELYTPAIIPSSERNALITLYNSTSGANWTNSSNWTTAASVFNAPGTECSWYGVICDGSQAHVIGLNFEGALNESTEDYLGNNLTGTLPNLSPLTNLQTISFYNNHLSGSIPDLSTLVNLISVEFGANQFSGSISSLSALASLQSFSAFSNQLTGSIPDLSKLAALQRFNVENNQLTGTIPPLTGLSNLGLFYASYNQFTGSIPDLQGLTSLYGFRINNAQLTGYIPDLTGLTNLRDFGVENNQLTGAIPASLSRLPVLVNFQVGGNNLSGAVPAAPIDLSPAGSKLCPNSLLIKVDDTAWDEATAATPWYRNCGTAPTSQLAAVSINGGNDPVAGIPFAVVIQAQDVNGIAANVAGDTGTGLQLVTGTGSLGGTLICTIPAGGNSCTLSAVTYSVAESGVVVEAVPPIGSGLSLISSAPFTVEAQGQTIFTVTPVTTANGAILPSTPVTVNRGDTASFTVTPNSGYRIASVTGCSGTLAGSTYTTGVITTNCSLTATFSAVPVTTYLGTTPDGGRATASFTDGGLNCGIQYSQFLDIRTVRPALPTPPAGATFPQGLFQFTTAACDVGSTIKLTLTYTDSQGNPKLLPAGSVYYKYGPTSANPTQHWYQYPATIMGNTVVINITDGGAGDDDLTANGGMIDPGGPALPAAIPPPGSVTTISAPTLNVFTLIGLILLIGMWGAFETSLKKMRASAAEIFKGRTINLG